MKQTVKLGCRLLVALLCLAMFASVITVPAFAAPTPDISSLAGGDLSFLLGMLEQYNKVKDDPDAAEQMKEYVEEKYNSDTSFKESADSMLGSDSAEGGNTLDNMNSVIDNVFTEEFTITWKVNGETYFVSEQVQYGETPTKPADPAGYEDEDYIYTFEGWTPVVVPAKANATYIAVFSATEKAPVENGVVITFVTGNGTIVKSFASAEDVTADGINTDKAADSNFTYTFKEWTVEGDVWTAQYDKTAVSKGWADILTSGKVVEDYFGSIDNVMDAVQNGASVEDLKESIQHQQKVEQEKAEAEERGEEYIEPTYTVTWKLDGREVAVQEYTFMKLIQAPAVESMSAGKYVSWNMSYVMMPEKNIVVTGKTVDIVEKIVAEVNGLPMNYGEYEMTYENGVVTLYVNVDASNYNEILLDVLGDVRGGTAQSAYKNAIMAFLQTSATEMYNSKTNTIEVNGYEVFGIDGYSASQLLDLLNTVQQGNYGEIISTEGLKNAILSDIVTPQDILNMGDDGVIATYDITLGANGKQDFDVDFNVALKGDLDMLRNSAKAIFATVDYAVATGGDLNVEIVLPGAFTMMLAKALNHADISDQTKQTIVAGLSECATVGELMELFDLIEYEHFIEIVEYMFDNVTQLEDKEAAAMEKIEELRPAFDLFKKYGDLLIEKAPESVDGKQASLTIKSVYNLIKSVGYEDLAKMSQLKDADALVGSDVYDGAIARVANKLGVSTSRAQAIVDRMVETFADYQNRFPESAKGEQAFDTFGRMIDLIYNQIPEKFNDAKLTDTYKGDGEFSFSFSKTYSPAAWLKSVLDNVTIIAYGRSLTLGDYVPVREITSDVAISVTVTDLYSVTFVDEQGNELFKGFLPYGAQLAPYCRDHVKEGYTQVLYDENGFVVTEMPAADSVITVANQANKFTVTFVDEQGNVLFSDLFAWGTTPVYGGTLPTKDSDHYKHYSFFGWADANGVVYSAELPAVYGDATYVVSFAESTRYYTIGFDILGNLVEQQYQYGEVPAYNAELDYLNFKGWQGYGYELPEVTGDATYVAKYTATITFLVNGEVYAEVEVDYGTPFASFVPTAPVKNDIELGASDFTTYVFDAWINEATGAGLTNAVANVTYGATFDDVQTSYGNGIAFDAAGNRFDITIGELTQNGRRLSATAEIPAVVLQTAIQNGHSVKIVASEGGKKIEAVIGNDALCNLNTNASGNVSLTISKLIGEEAGWPAGITFNQYSSVYVFDLAGTELTGDYTIDVVIPFASNAAKYNTFLWTIGGNGASKIPATVTSDSISFSTGCKTYYAVEYVQYLFTVEFYNVNTGALVSTVTVNKNLGETLAGKIPAFAPTSTSACYVNVQWGRMVNNTFRALPNNYNNDVAAYFEANVADSKFYAKLSNVAHSWDVEILQDATCTEDGLGVRTCTVCGHSEEYVIDALGHDWEWIALDDEFHAQWCYRCDMIINQGAHVWGDDNVCDICGHIRGSETDYAQITFIVLDKQYTLAFAKGAVPTLDADKYLFDTLNFKGWLDEEGNLYTTLPAVTGPATYTASYTATITFIVDNEVYAQVEFAYGAMPTISGVYAPDAEWVGNDYYEYDLKWMAEDGTFGFQLATAHATYVATVEENIYSFGDDVTIERIENADGSVTYKVTVNGYSVAEGYVFVKLNIAPIVMFANVENSNLEINVNGDATIAGAHAIAMNFDNAALNSIRDSYLLNPLTEEIYLSIQSRNNAGWPNAAMDKYAAVYGFEIEDYGFNSQNGKVSITVPFEKDADEYTAKIFYIGDNGAEDMSALIVDGKLSFTTNHFSYYGVEYTEIVNGGDTSDTETDTTVPGGDTSDTETDTAAPGGDDSSETETETESGIPGGDTSDTETDTTVPGGETDSTAETETESTGTEDPEKGKNGWWIFLIILLVFIAILIVAYILYGHNLFPKNPATEEPTEPEAEELTDAQKGSATLETAVVEEVVKVDHVSADEADTLMSDTQAVNAVVLVASTATGKMGAVNVGTLNEHYAEGDKIDIESLKEKKLIAADCKRVKILADGNLDKALIVEANSFSLQAIKMITLTGGQALKLQADVAEETAEETADETLADETAVEETAVEETPVEETPVEETPVEETAVEETAVEETPVEETAVEETPAEETDAE